MGGSGEEVEVEAGKHEIHLQKKEQEVLKNKSYFYEKKKHVPLKQVRL